MDLLISGSHRRWFGAWLTLGALGSIRHVDPRASGRGGRQRVDHISSEALLVIYSYPRLEHALEGWEGRGVFAGHGIVTTCEILEKSEGCQ
jgi:hypothetical protein